MTFHIDVGGHLYIEESIYSIEILTYLPISKKIHWHTFLSQLFIAKTREDLFCAILNDNAKGHVTLFKAIHKIQRAVTILKPCLN